GIVMAKKAKKRKSKVKKTKRAAARRPKAKTKRPVKKTVRKTKAVKPKTKKPAIKKAAPKKAAPSKPKTYKILLMGASYGSLLASKLLFGGHSIHLVCLPAEADLINAEGFKVKLPIRGRSEPVLLESRKLPGKVTAGPAAIRRITISSGSVCRSRNIARRACANCSMRSPNRACRVCRS